MKKMIFTAISLSLLFLNNAYSLTFAPMVSELASEGRGSVKPFEIKSGASEKSVVQISIYKRVISEDGAESLMPEPNIGSLIKIYPSAQFLLNPNENKNVRVSWVGSGDIKEEQAYRIVVEQLPVRLEKPEVNVEHNDDRQIKLLFNFIGSLYVKPKDIINKLSVENVQLKNKNQEISVLINNLGNRHVLLSKCKITILDKNKKEISLVVNLEEHGGLINVLAKNQRKVSFSAKDLNLKDMKSIVKVQFE